MFNQSNKGVKIMIHLPFQRTVGLQVKKYFLYKSDGWIFSKGRKEMFIGEYSSWKKWYLPVDIKGLTILDIGAGEGESARFFLDHGAKKVICIECDDFAFKNLELNSKGKPIKCYHKFFELSDLNHKFDFIKMDIEGGEKDLLKLNERLHIPLVMEVHGIELAKQLYKKGYVLKHEMGNTISIHLKHGLPLIKKINCWLCYAY